MNLSLELRDLKTSQTMLVPPEGLVFGREGGDADVTFRDAGISKRHARVFQQGNSWMLQDLGSSNGTWMKGQRIGDAVKLNPGDIFILNKQQLQVMSVVAPTSLGAATEGEMPAADEEQQNEPTPRPAPAPKAPPGRGVQEPRSAANKVPSQGPAKRPAPAMLRPAPDDLPEEPEPEGRGEDEEPMPDDTGAANAEDAAAALKSKGIGYFFIAVPKALAFYLAAVPVMLFNPVGTIRNGPKKMKFEAMGPIELIPYALVPGLIGAAMGFLGGLVAQLISMIFYHGSLSIGALLGSLIVGPIIAVISAVLTGFLLHPVLGWIVKFLKGTSDAKSRTNYFIQMETAVVLTQVPSFLAALIPMIHLPLVGIIPVIISAAASVITTMVAYFWFVHFGVVKWFQYVLLVLAGLSALGALVALPAAIRGPATIGSVGTVGSADMDAEMAKLKAQGEAAMKQNEQAQKDAQAAMKAGQDALAKAQKDVKDAKEQLPDGVQEVPVADAKDTKTPPPPKEKEQPKKEEKVAVKDTPPPPPSRDVAGSGNYAQWNSRREQIEKFITDDPMILSRVPGLPDMYKKYEQFLYDDDQKWAKLTAKKPSERRYNEHMRDAELFGQTDKLVNEMWERMGH